MLYAAGFIDLYAAVIFFINSIIRQCVVSDDRNGI